MVDCVLTSATMKTNSQTFLFNLKKTDFSLKKATKSFLLENDGSILCLESTDVDITRVLLAQVLILFKEDRILKENLNEILFTDFSSFTTMSSEQTENFLKNFPDLLVCILDNEVNEEQLSKQSLVLQSWINITKVNGKKIIFIVKNPKHLEKNMMDNEITNVFKLRLDNLWKENEITLNNEAICEVENNLEINESTSARALDECMNIYIKEEISSEKPSSHDEATTEDADLENLLQSLGVTELDAVNNRAGNTQLHLAARDGKKEIVKSLLVHGAKKGVKNNDGETALHLAAQRGHSAIVHMLLEYGFDVNAIDMWQDTPLYYASLNHNDAHLIEILLKFGADMERKDKCGRRALHWASGMGHSTVVISLLKNGANINAQDNYRDTPLHRATLNNKQKVVLILLLHGALLNIKNIEQQNALDLAKHRGFHKIIQLLDNHKDFTTKYTYNSQRCRKLLCKQARQ